jgi:multicomponent Na+:H+ antiporter subunit A
MWNGPIFLAAASLITGLFPNIVGTLLAQPAIHAVLGSSEQAITLKLWHGWTTALALSGLTVALGIFLYALSPRIRSFTIRLAPLRNFGPERAYELLLAGTLSFADRLTTALQNGYLRNYLLTILFFTSALILWTLPSDIRLPAPESLTTIRILPVVVCILIVAGAILACLTLSRFTAILALGVVGLGVGMLFFLFSGPDLALTQILVETLALVLFVLAFYRLPVFKNYSKPSAKIRDALIASAFGAIMTLVVLVGIGTGTTDKSVSAYMAENSLPLAQGRNVVNVILVDFRALDTLGEITVLAIAAFGVWAIIRVRPRKFVKEEES